MGRQRIPWLGSPERKCDYKRGTPQMEKHLHPKG